MKYRKLGKTNYNVSEISIGCWQLGGKWGTPFDEEIAYKTLNTASSNGINFFDTADVYKEGQSEKYCGKYIKSIEKQIFIATKCGRRLNPHTSKGYNEKNIRKFIDDNIKNMNVEKIDLIQLHCPPTEVYYMPEVFKILDNIKDEGKIQNYGVSVEKVEEALKAIEFPNVSTIQIIFNIFRQRPSEIFFKEAKKKKIGIIVRVPLASGLLTGKFNQNTTFDDGDHRKFNRNGAAFDRGETFSGVDFNKGLKAVEELKKIFGYPENLAPYALRWILMFDAISCIIPGASRDSHVLSNAQASDLPPLSNDQMDKIKDVYEKYIKKSVHQLW
ncbi:MAG: aldo/keto reductase [Candidatus Lokiarchaeota archaeon]|nr:aldo/keto reductase [Candidatus Lokiarchaeota archaeon]